MASFLKSCSMDEQDIQGLHYCGWRENILSFFPVHQIITKTPLSQKEKEKKKTRVLEI